jgi:anaerobic selenocysteine-containing dehydrogenase
MSQLVACSNDEGTIAGRDNSILLSYDTLQEAEVVVVWGMNFMKIHPDWFPYLKNKSIIIIDPAESLLSEVADLYIQINPHCDLHLALLLSRFTIIEGSHDQEFLQKYADNYEEFYELTQSLRIKSTLESINVSLGQIGAFLELIREKKILLLVGSGVLCPQNGNEALEAIDAFGMLLGLFGKEGCGMHYLGKIDEGLGLPFRGSFEFMEEVDLSFVTTP